MAYNSSKGPQQQGDLKFESDPDDTQIDFENDFIALKTNAIQRFIVSGSFITSSIPISCSSGVTAGSFTTATSAINANHISSSLNISGSNFYANGVLLTPGVVSAVANGVDNRVATFSSADALNGEANLTFDGTDLGVSDKIFHIGDTDTFINFTTDDINFQAGGVNFLDLTEDTQNEATFNEGGVDVDFRVESENDTHMLFVDAANDAVSIGVSTDAPAAVLEVVGDAAAGKPALTVIHAENTNNAVNIFADSVTTAKALRISADALTTGNALYIDDNSSSTGTRNTAIVIQNHTGAINATALTVQSDGGVTGVNLDKNYSDLTEASIVGLNIDFDKTGASTSDNNMYGIQLDMDNTTATNGNNYMYGLHVTPTLTHAADAGGSFVYGAHISAQGGTNGSSLVQGARIEAAGGDFNYGIQLDVEDGPNNVDLRIESSADSGDYFQIQTTTNGATTITTQDDNATAAHLTFNVDGDITLAPVGGGITGSGGVHITGSVPRVAIGDKGGTGANDGMLFIRPSDTSNKVLCLMQSKADDGNRVIFAVTGSGQVLCGGAHFGGVLNISGSKDEKLISAKSDTLDPAFYISGSGELYNSGSVILNTVEPALMFTSSINPSANCIVGLNSADNILIQNNTSNKHIVLKASDAGTIREGLRIDGAVPEVVVNQGSESLVNFRVESDTNTHMLFVTGSSQVGIGVSDPAIGVTLDISGSAIRLRNSSAGHAVVSGESAPGVAGEIRWDSNYIYVCIATDTWKRAIIQGGW